MTDRNDELFSIRVLPTRSETRNLLHAHLEAHDHLAIATDLRDGSVCVIGPRARATEITDVVGEIARALGLLVVAE